MKSFFSISFFILFVLTNMAAQDALDLKREADALYRLEKFDRAEELYRQSLELDHRPETLFNLGNAIFNQGRHDEAAQFFSQARDAFSERGNKSDAAHNLGNTFFEKNELEQALNAYRESLIHNPGNEEARNNFLLAKELMQMMPPQPQQDQGDEGEEGDQPPPDMPDNGSESIAEQESGQDEGEDDQSEGIPDGLEEDDQTAESMADELAETDIGELDPDQNMLDQLLELAEEEDQRTQRRMNEERRQPSQQVRDW